MPSGSGDKIKEYLMIYTEDLKIVSDYSGLNFNECMNLDCYTFKLLARDGHIYNLRKTKEGQEYLENCWLPNQTKPDRKVLREQFGGGAK